MAIKSLMEEALIWFCRVVNFSAKMFADDVTIRAPWLRHGRHVARQSGRIAISQALHFQ